MPELKIANFKIIAPFSLEIYFDDGAIKSINFLPVLKGSMYGPLAQKSNFDKVYLDSEVHTISWPGGADFDPETLYNWDVYENELITRSKTWN